MTFIGNNIYGQVGLCSGYSECQFGDNLPALDFGTDFVPEMMSLGYYHSCFVSTNGSLMCFGSNEQGQVQESRSLSAFCLFYQLKNFVFALFHQLGYGDSVDRGGCSAEISTLPPVDLGTDFNIAQIAMMGHHSCALSIEDELKCWGKYSHSLHQTDFVSLSIDERTASGVCMDRM